MTAKMETAQALHAKSAMPVPAHRIGLGKRLHKDRIEGRLPGGRGLLPVSHCCS